MTRTAGEDSRHTGEGTGISADAIRTTAEAMWNDEKATCNAGAITCTTREAHHNLAAPDTTTPPATPPARGITL